MINNHKFIKKLQKYEAKKNICHIIQINFSHKNDYKMTRLSMTIIARKRRVEASMKS